MNIIMLGNSRAGKTNYIVTLFHQLTMCGRSFYDISYADEKGVNSFIQKNDLLYTPNESGNPSFCPNTTTTTFLKYDLTYQDESFLKINSFDYKGGLTKAMADGENNELSKIIACNDIVFVFLDSTILNTTLSDEEKVKKVDLEAIEKILFNSLKSKVKFNNIIDVSLILTKIDKVPQERRDDLCNKAQKLFNLTKNKIQNQLRCDGDLRILGTYGVTVIGENKTIVGTEIVLKENQKLEPKNILSSFFGTLIEYRKQFAKDLQKFESFSYDHHFWKEVGHRILDFLKGCKYGLWALILKAPEYLDACWKKYRKRKNMMEIELLMERLKGKEDTMKAVMQDEY